MTHTTATTTLSPTEVIARDLIRQRVASRRRESRSLRRHIRVALILRGLAERLDPSEQQTPRRQPQTPRYS